MSFTISYLSWSWWIDGLMDWLRGVKVYLLTNDRMAPVAYTTEGIKLAKQLYEETMEELAFAGVREIVEGFSKSK